MAVLVKTINGLIYSSVKTKNGLASASIKTINGLDVTGGGGFSPSDIPGLDIWIAADEIVGLNDGDPVATWSDLSGNGNDYTQATGSKRPSYETGILNGLPAVRFVRSNQSEMTGSLVGGFPSTMFAVTIPRATLTGYVGISAVGSSILMLGNLNTSNRWGTFTSSDQPANTQLSNGTPYILTIVSTGSFFLDGVSDGTFTGSSVDHGTRIGGLASAGQSYDGDILEVIYYDSALSSSDRGDVETYLANKYGL